MSKQEMARTLIARGCKLAFNTLRKYSSERLEAMLVEQHSSTQLQAVQQVETYIPTDRELYTAALGSSLPAAEPLADARPSRLVTAICAPFILFGVLFGLWQ
jgi:hypothetical protein